MSKGEINLLMIMKRIKIPLTIIHHSIRKIDGKLILLFLSNIFFNGCTFSQKELQPAVTYLHPDSLFVYNTYWEELPFQTRMSSYLRYFEYKSENEDKNCLTIMDCDNRPCNWILNGYNFESGLCQKFEKKRHFSFDTSCAVKDSLHLYKTITYLGDSIQPTEFLNYCSDSVGVQILIYDKMNRVSYSTDHSGAICWVKKSRFSNYLIQLHYRFKPEEKNMYKKMLYSSMEIWKGNE